MNIKYFCIDTIVRYWEDGMVNDIDDISWDEQESGEEPRMPLHYKIENPSSKDESYGWRIKIDFETGNVVDWPKGCRGNIHYKVCDGGIYWLETNYGKIKHKINSYVPEIIDFYGGSYGDYIVMNINEDGHIKEWDVEKQKTLIESFLKNKGF